MTDGAGRLATIRHYKKLDELVALASYLCLYCKAEAKNLSKSYAEIWPLAY